MASPTSSLHSQIPMEPQKHKLALDEEEEEEEEEVLSLQSRQFQHRSNNNIDTNTAADTITLPVNISSTNGNGNGNGNGSLVISTSNSSINDDSETLKLGVSSPCGSPHEHGGNVHEDEHRVHNLNSVYFDQHHGTWKCHHCNWTYGIGTPWIDHVQNHKECSHTLINFENFNQQESCFVLQTEGAYSVDGVSAENCGGVTSSAFETSPRYVEVLVNNSEIQKILIKDFNLQLNENSDDEGRSGSSLTPLKETLEEHNFKSKPSDSETRVVGDLGLIEEIDQEVTELDVEKVLEKQNTHDLYCPNCNSCITRKVILRRRTQKIRIAHRKPKHAKTDAVLPSESDAYSDANSANSANGPSHDIANICSNDCSTPAVDDNNCDREPDVFRCLSCFSFFIPTGNGFKLFRVSSPENDNVQDPQKISTANTNWFFSIFATRKRKTTTEQGNAAVDHTQVHGMNQDASSGFPNNVSSLNGSDHSVMPHADRTMVDTGEHPDGSYSKLHQSGTESLNPSIMEPLLLNKSPEGMDLKSNLPLVESSSIAGSVNDMRGASCEAGMGIVSSMEQKFTESALTTSKEKSGDAAENSGNDVIVTIDKEPVKHGDSEIVCIDSVETTSLLNNMNQTNMGEQRGIGVRESQQWEILKSIVYGGLIESITSLGVVSSAAGAGAATLNIIALGLANLIGGLFIIGHNLLDLKNYSSNEVNEQEDRYQETLGRRDNFSLHATVSILSFLIFGLLPPVMYGFSFRASDDRDLKLAAVAGASFVCIILLAIGKAHIQRKQPKPYFSTVLYFSSIGLMASGASYIAGDLIGKLLQKISGFESSVPFPELKPMEPTAWTTY